MVSGIAGFRPSLRLSSLLEPDAEPFLVEAGAVPRRRQPPDAEVPPVPMPQRLVLIPRQALGLLSRMIPRGAPVPIQRRTRIRVASAAIHLQRLRPRSRPLKPPAGRDAQAEVAPLGVAVDVAVERAVPATASS